MIGRRDARTGSWEGSHMPPCVTGKDEHQHPGSGRSVRRSAPPEAAVRGAIPARLVPVLLHGRVFAYYGGTVSIGVDVEDETDWG
jgi:hypothetical protein